MVLAGLPLPDAAHHVSAALNAAERPGVGLGEVAVLAVEVGGTVADENHVLVFGLNGGVLIENALCGKKASVHVGARTHARIHRVQDVVIARDHVGQRQLHVAHLVEKNDTDLDVEAVGLGLLVDFLQERFGLFEDVRLGGSAGLVQHKHDVSGLCLALTGEGKGDLGFEVLVERGRGFDVLC